jgi:Fic family protein
VIIALRTLLGQRSPHEIKSAALAVAVVAHADVVRIHPFEDGNGRSARALMNWVLVYLGLRPIPIEVPKQEYHDCLNHYYAHRDRQPLVDLILRIAQIPS